MSLPATSAASSWFLSMFGAAPTAAPATVLGEDASLWGAFAAQLASTLTLSPTTVPLPPFASADEGVATTFGKSEFDDESEDDDSSAFGLPAWPQRPAATGTVESLAPGVVAGWASADDEASEDEPASTPLASTLGVDSATPSREPDVTTVAAPVAPGGAGVATTVAVPTPTPTPTAATEPSPTSMSSTPAQVVAPAEVATVVLTSAPIAETIEPAPADTVAPVEISGSAAQVAAAATMVAVDPTATVEARPMPTPAAATTTAAESGRTNEVRAPEAPATTPRPEQAAPVSPDDAATIVEANDPVFEALARPDRQAANALLRAAMGESMQMSVRRLDPGTPRPEGDLRSSLGDLGRRLASRSADVLERRAVDSVGATFGAPRAGTGVTTGSSAANAATALAALDVEDTVDPFTTPGAENFQDEASSQDPAPAPSAVATASAGAAGSTHQDDDEEDDAHQTRTQSTSTDPRSGAEAARPTTTLDRPEVADLGARLRQAVAQAIVEEGRERLLESTRHTLDAQIQVRPAALGRVEIQITRGVDGAMNVLLVAAHEDAARALDHEIDDLVDELVRNRLEVNEVHVRHGERALADQDRSSAQRQAWQEQMARDRRAQDEARERTDGREQQRRSKQGRGQQMREGA